VSGIPQFVSEWLSFLPPWMQAVFYYGVVALVLFITVILCMAFLTLIERRVIGSIQARIGPNRVGPMGIGELREAKFLRRRCLCVCATRSLLKALTTPASKCSLPRLQSWSFPLPEKVRR
jgi:hypothetical protein